LNSRLEKPRPIPFKTSGGRLLLDLSGVPRDPVDTIVRLRLDGPSEPLSPIDPLLGRAIPLGAANASSEYGKAFEAGNILSGKAGGFEAGIHASAYWLSKSADRPEWIEVQFAQPEKINGLVLAEPRGRYNTRAFKVEYETSDGWKTLHAGTTIGPDFALLFPPVQTQRLRLAFLEHREHVALGKFAAYRATE
jgi:hypothetical protein